jgi:hypothetical protein
MTNETKCSSTKLLPSTLPAAELEAISGGRHWNYPDSDGYVPEYYGRWGGKWLGYTAYLSNNPSQRAIFYDTYNMRNAGPNDWARLRAHEWGHAFGWDHGQGSPCFNPSYYPRMRITGR